MQVPGQLPVTLKKSGDKAGMTPRERGSGAREPPMQPGAVWSLQSLLDSDLSSVILLSPLPHFNASSSHWDFEQVISPPWSSVLTY